MRRSSWIATSPLALATLFSCISPVLTQPITPAPDGTGTLVTPTDNHFDITGGTQTGVNLFHSFDRFNVSTGNTANFVGTPDLANILGRVTGGSPSVIDGLLRVSGSNANLFLMNPAGIIFGTNARLDVGGAFAATTATGIGFENGVFNAFSPNNYANLSSLPTGFRFDTATSLIFNEGHLAVEPGQSLLLVGDRVVQTGTLAAEGGNISIISVPGTGEVQINQAGMVLGLTLGAGATTSEFANFEPLTMLDLPSQLTGGNVSHASELVVEPDGRVRLGEGSRTVTSGTSLISGLLDAANPVGLGGSITITGLEVDLVDATLNASGAIAGGSIRVGGDYQGNGSLLNAVNTSVNAGSQLFADATNVGDGGSIIVWADDRSDFLGSLSATGGVNGGDGGFAEVSGKQILNLGSGWADRFDLSAVNGQAGELLLDPNDITISSTAGTSTISTPEDGTDSSNTLLDTDIGTFLDNTGSLTITTANGTGGNGDITVASGSNINWTTANDFTLAADGDITLNTVTIGSTGGGGINLNSDRDENGSGAISITGSTLTTNGGAIQLFGGATDLSLLDLNNLPTTAFAQGNAGRTDGVSLSNSTLNAGTGNITLVGKGFDDLTTNDHEGIALLNNSTLQTTGTGQITLVGQAGDGSSVSDGLQIDGSLSTDAGGITLIGLDSPNSLGDGSTGVQISATGSLTATGTGNITITGTSAGGNGFSQGVLLQAPITVANGTITINGTGGGSTTGGGNHGVDVEALVQATGTGNILINGTGGLGNSAAGVNLDQSVRTSSGNITIVGQANSASSGSDSVDGISFNGLTGAEVQSTDGGNISLTGIASPSTTGTFHDGIARARVRTTGNGSITLTGVGGAGGGPGLTLNYLSVEDGDLTITGTTGITNGSSDGVQVNGLIQSRSGNITIEGTVAEGSPGANSDGVSFNNFFNNVGAVSSTAGGNITITGRTATSTTGGEIQSANVSTTGTGTINLTGISGSELSNGISVSSLTSGDEDIDLASDRNITLNNATITTNLGNISLSSDRDENGSGAISIANSTLTTNGGAIELFGGATDLSLLDLNNLPTTAFAQGNAAIDDGIRISNSTLNAGTGNITLLGKGFDDFTTGDHEGISLIGGTLTTAGVGNINLIGSSGDGAGGNNGVSLDTASSINTVDGNITISGTSTTTTTAGSANIGIESDGTIASTGAGLITLQGFGGAGGLDNMGIRLGANTVISAVDGGISLEGTGGLLSEVDVNDGIQLNGVTITTTGTAPITLTGTGGAIGTGGTLSTYGIRLSNATIASNTGDILLIGIDGGEDGIAIVAVQGTSFSSIQGDLAFESVASGAGAIISLGDSNISVPNSDLTITADPNAIIENSGAIFAGTIQARNFDLSYPGGQILWSGNTSVQNNFNITAPDTRLLTFLDFDVEVGNTIDWNLESLSPLSAASNTSIYAGNPSGSANPNAITILTQDNIFLISGTIGTNSLLNAGNISLTSNQGTITTTNANISSASTSGEGGSIILNAAGDLTLGNIDSSALLNAGDITLTSTQGAIATTDADISSNSTDGNGGSVTLTAAGDVTVSNINSSALLSAGNITLTSNQGAITTTNGILNAIGGVNGGDVSLSAPGDIATADVTTLTTGLFGNSGALRITSTQGNIDTSSGVLTASALGNGGDVQLRANDSLKIGSIDARSLNLEDAGGAITFTANNLITLDTGTIRTNGNTLEFNVPTIVSGEFAIQIGDSGTIRFDQTLDGPGTLILATEDTAPNSISFLDDVGGLAPFNSLRLDSPLTTSPLKPQLIQTVGDLFTEEIFASQGLTAISQAGNIVTGNILSPGQALNLTAKQQILTANLSSSLVKGSGGNITLTSENDRVSTLDLISSGTEGGDINVFAQVAIGTGVMNSSGSQGDGGNVFLDPREDIQVASINAQGGPTGTGGAVTAITDRFFRARGTFVDRNGLNTSISTAGGLAGGTVVLRHGGSGQVPFIVGDPSVNGTAGVVSRGNDDVLRTIAPERFLYTYSQDPDPSGLRLPNGIDAGRLQIISVENPNLPENPTPTPPITLPDIPEDPASVAEDPFTGITALIQDLIQTPEEDGNIPRLPSPHRVLAIDPSILTPSLEIALNIGDTSYLWPPNTPITALPLGFNLQANDPNTLVTPLDDLVGLIEQEFEAEYEQYTGGNLTDRKTDGVTVRNALKDIEKKTGNRSVILYALSLPDHLDLVLVMPEGPPIRRIIPSATAQRVQAASTLLRNLITDTGSDRYKIPAQAFYDWMISPFESELKALNIDTLIFSMDGGLRLLPTASFYDGQQFLVEKFSVGSIPSLSLTDVRYQDLDGMKVLAMGASEFQTLPPLPAVPTELETVSTDFWEGSSFLNQDFTYDRLDQERKRTGSEILHLATHADFHSTDPSQSFLQLWDRQLKIEDLRQLDWDFSPAVELLVLSACRTAVGDINSELGFAGLAVQSGVKSALASLWYVSDAGTLALMSEVYRELALPETQIKTEALQQTQLSMLRGEIRVADGEVRGIESDRGIPVPTALQAQSNLDLSHPYYWAAFTIVGSPW